MEPEILNPSWFFSEDTSPTFDHQVESFENISFDDFTSIVPFSSTISNTDHHAYCPIYDVDNLKLPSLIDDFSMELDAFFDPILNSQNMGTIHYENPQESQSSFLPQALNIPKQDMEMENQFRLPHLLEAIGEALEQGHNTLSQVILKCISPKVSPLGDPLERLAYNLSQNHDLIEQENFIKKEAFKSFPNFFKAIYQGLPHGRIAHFVANSEIFQSIPEDSEVIHIIDFDMGEGVQWPPLMDAIAHQQKALKLILIKWEKDDSFGTNFVSTQWNSEEIKRNLHEHAKSCGLKLRVEEHDIEDLKEEIKKLYKKGGNGNFVVFNCMVGLPHMGRVRRRSNLLEFMQIAKDFIKALPSKNRGLVTFGDGEACDKLRNSTNFMSFFNGHLVHYQALLESLESNFPFQFLEARTAMENLFVAPYISCEDWSQKWEDMRQYQIPQSETELVGRSLREETLLEVGEMIRGMEGCYEVKIEGNNGNEMVLEWKGIQLMRVSTLGN